MGILLSQEGLTSTWIVRKIEPGFQLGRGVTVFYLTENSSVSNKISWSVWNGPFCSQLCWSVIIISGSLPFCFGSPGESLKKNRVTWFSQDSTSQMGSKKVSNLTGPYLFLRGRPHGECLMCPQIIPSGRTCWLPLWWLPSGSGFMSSVQRE